MKKLFFILAVLVFPISLIAQSDSLQSKLLFNADFRFRAEQDWNSKKSDGALRDDRTRLRYRLRTGIKYRDNWYEFGFRIRTGNPNKQQDAQLTLGDSFEEFGTLPIGLDKAYFQGKWKALIFWVGKNTFPFEKSNELFWSDNVNPEGIFVGKGFSINSNLIDSINLRGGHFIISDANKTIERDTYFQGYQAHLMLNKNKIELFPAMYLFKNVANIPDGNQTFMIDYSILHTNARIQLLKKPLLNVEFDYYTNLEDYNNNDSITSDFKDEKSGMVLGLKYGRLKQKGDWIFKVSYANLQQYAAVDFMAQNDWARWDYSSFGSSDGRLTNFRGIELVTGLMIDKNTSLKMKFYNVEQLIPYGTTKETGSRIRIDLDTKF